MLDVSVLVVKSPEEVSELVVQRRAALGGKIVRISRGKTDVFMYHFEKSHQEIYL